MVVLNYSSIPLLSTGKLSKSQKKKLNVWRATAAGKQLFESQRDSWKSKQAAAKGAGSDGTQGKKKHVTAADLQAVVKSAMADQAKAKADEEEMTATLSAALAEAAGKPANEAAKYSPAAEVLRAKLNAIKGKVSKKGD